jgi:hypothetical protein
MGDWKNDRAEAAMREHEAQMMKKLNPKKDKVETREFTLTISATGENAGKELEDFLTELKGEESILNRVDGVSVILTEIKK